MNAAMLMLVASTMNAPQPAVSELSASPSFTMGHHVTFVTETPEIIQAAKSAAQAAKPSPTHQAAGKSVMVMAQGGLLFNNGTGFVIGIAGAFQPMKTHEQFEVNADFNFAHNQGLNGWILSFQGQYNIKMNDSKMTPFVAGGLGIGHANYNTSSGFQLSGGIQAALASGRAIRVQVRFLFANSTTTTLLLFGFAF